MAIKLGVKIIYNIYYKFKTIKIIV